MVRRQINSFGTITIPKDMREFLGILGTTSMLQIETRESNNIREIVLRKSEDLSGILSKYRNISNIISKVSECVAAVVWNNTLLLMMVNGLEESFIGKTIYVSEELRKEFCNYGDSYTIIGDRTVPFLTSNKGEVVAIYKIPDTGDDVGYFVLLKGTKQDSNNDISKEEMLRRLKIVQDIVNIGGV